VLWGIVGASSDQFNSLEMAVALAQLAEEAGFESVWTADHVVMPATYSSPYPFSDSGKFKNMGKWRPEVDTSDDVTIPDPLIHMSFMASHTHHIKFGTGVIILPQRNPLVLAKQAASFDHLSDGRLLLGLGIGWLREEFDALGVSWENRGRRANEYIQVLRALWREHVVEYHGEYVDFPPIRCDPHPANGVSIPIHVGGHYDAAARRAGRIADGFFPAIYPNSDLPSRLPALIETMRKSAREAGRDESTVEITSGGARTAEAAKWFVDLGVDRLVIQARSRDYESLRDELLRFGDDVIARVG
jgi:probable F420-dependent oxidoreductase